MARLAASSSSSQGDVLTSTSQNDAGKSARPPLLFFPKYLVRSKSKKRQHVRPTQSRIEKSSMKVIHKPRTSEFTYFKQRRLNSRTSAPVARRIECQQLGENDAQTPPGYLQEPVPLRSPETENSPVSASSEDLKDDPVSCGNYKDSFGHVRKELQLLASKNSIQSRPIDIETLLSRLEVVVHIKPGEKFEKDSHDQVSTFTDTAKRFRNCKPDLFDSFPLNTPSPVADSLLLSRQDSDACELGMLSPFKVTPGGGMMDFFNGTGDVWDTKYSTRDTELELDFDRCSPREALQEFIDFERQDEQRQQELAGHAVEYLTNSNYVSSPGFLDEEWLSSEADYCFQRSQHYISPLTTHRPRLSSEADYCFQSSQDEQRSQREQEPAGHEYLTNSYNVSSPGFLDEEWLSGRADYYLQRSQHYVSPATPRDLQRSQHYISTIASQSPGRFDFGQRSSPEAFGMEEDIKALNLKFGFKKNFPERKRTFYGVEEDSCDAAVSWQNRYDW